MKKEKPHFGQVVHRTRKQKRLSLFQLGVRTGLHPQTISQLERMGTCSLKKAMQIAAALGIDAIPVVS